MLSEDLRLELIIRSEKVAHGRTELGRHRFVVHHELLVFRVELDIT